MSLTFDSSLDFARIPLGDETIGEPWTYPHSAFTATFKFKATAAAAGTLMSFMNVSTHRHKIKVASNGTSITVERNYGEAVSSALTGAVGQFISVAIRLTGNFSNSQTFKLYVKVGSATTQTVSLDNSGQAFDYLGDIWIGSSDAGENATGEYADLKMWLASLSDSEIEEEFAQQSAKRTSSLILSNDLNGANIDDALASDVSNYPWAVLFDQKGYNGSSSLVTGTKPTLGTSTVSYTSLPTLAGGFSLPSTAPVSNTAAAIAQSVGGSALGGSSVALTFATLPGINTLLVVPLGGWLADATDGVGATISDNQPAGGLTWTKRLVKQRTALPTQDVWVMAWTAVVTRSQAPFTITVTPSGATANGYYSVSAHEVLRANLSSPVESSPPSGSGSGTSGSVSITTTNAKDLLFALASWLNSEGAATTPTNYTSVYAKQGQAGLHVSTRYVTSTGSGYGPTWGFSQTGGGNVNWVGGVLAVKEQAATTAPTITTTSLPSAAVGTAYEEQIEATGTGPLTFEVTAGALPSWASISENGLVTGVPTSGAGASFEVTATGPGGSSSPVTLTLGMGVTPTITTTSLGTLVVGAPVSIPIITTGTGTMSYRATAGSLPDGMVLTSNAVSGAPTTVGSGSVTLVATGDAGDSAPAVISWTIVATATLPRISTTGLDTAVVGLAYSYQMLADGTGPITWSVGAGKPPGLTLSASGLWTGSATLAGGYYFDVTATNAYDSHTMRFGLSVVPADTSAGSPWTQFLKAR